MSRSELFLATSHSGILFLSEPQEGERCTSWPLRRKLHEVKDFLFLDFAPGVRVNRSEALFESFDSALVGLVLEFCSKLLS